MLKTYAPESIAAPNGLYSHGIEVPPNARLLYIAGQIAIRPDGSIPSTIEEQTEVVWQNILAILADAGMGIADVVKISSFLTRFENFPQFAATRAKFLGRHRPASTTVVITALAKPEFLVEVEAIAAKVVAKKAAPKEPAARAAKKTSRTSRKSR